MSEKIWYVYEQDHHTGPFDKSELAEMFEQKRLQPQTLIWKEGQENWTALEEQEELADLLPEELPPPLPPLPEVSPEDETIAISIPDDFEVTIDDQNIGTDDETGEIAIPEDGLGDEDKTGEINVSEELLEPSDEDKTGEIEISEQSLDEDKTSKIDVQDLSSEDDVTGKIQVSLPDEAQDHGDFETFGTYRNESNGPLKRFHGKKIAKWTIGILSLLIAAGGVLWFFWDSSELPDFRGLLAQDKARLIKTSQVSYSKGLRVSFAMTKKGNDLWLGCNQRHEAEVHLRLSSLKGKILSTERVVLTTRGHMSAGIAHFSKYKIEHGGSLVAGAYSVEIFGNFVGLHSKLMTFLQDLKIFNFIDAIGKYSTRFKYKKDFLIISGKKADFEIKLKEFISRLHSKKIKPLQDIIERYRTYTGILERTLQVYREQLKKFRTSYSVVRAFEKEYAQKISPLLGSVLSDNNKIHVYLVDAEAIIANEYEMLLTFGKRVGELVSDISTTTKKYRHLKPSRKKKLDQEFSNRVKKLELLSISRLSKIEKELRRLKVAIP